MEYNIAVPVAERITCCLSLKARIYTAHKFLSTKTFVESCRISLDDYNDIYDRRATTMPIYYCDGRNGW